MMFLLRNICIFSTILIVICHGKSSIISDSEQQTKNIGDSAIFNCTVDNPDNNTVIWSKKDRDRPSDTIVLSMNYGLTMKDERFELKITDDKTGYFLHIHNIQPLDKAIYECQILISTTEKVTMTVELLVRTPPKIYDKFITNPTPVPVGKPVELKCLADGYPRPTISWKRELNAILPSGGSVFNGNIFKIDNVSKLDRGTYYCIAENGIGKPDKRIANLEVEFSPEISVPRPRIAQALNYDIELECKITAYPPPAIEWLKNGVVLSNSGHISISNTATADEITSTILKISTIDSEHYGDYYCRATNKAGRAEARINLFGLLIPNINYSGLQWSSSTKITSFISFKLAIIIWIFIQLII